MDGAWHRRAARRRLRVSSLMALDPVCGMTVDPAKAAGQFEHNGTTYYFCGKGCLAKFAADPEKYLAGTRGATEREPSRERSAEASRSQSEIRNPPSAIERDPVCGMTVDPAKAAGQFEHNGTTYYFCSKGC